MDRKHRGLEIPSNQAWLPCSPSGPERGPSALLLCKNELRGLKGPHEFLLRPSPSSVWLTDHYSKQCPMTRSPTIPLPAREPDLRARALHKSLANTIWAASSVQGESSRLAQDQRSEDGIGIRRKRADGSTSPTWLQSGSPSGEWMGACARWPAA